MVGSMKLSAALAVAAAFPSAAGTTASEVPLATFDGAAETTRDWQPVNDPVMGGQSASNLTVDTDHKVGLWEGDVKIVPFLKAPGFCNLQSPGLYKTAKFPDLSGMEGVSIRAREAHASGLSHFNVQ